ncbi:Na(+)/H(+) antiporter subunit B [Streptomyces sp. NPDC094038]|uniref:Na(+)/H(+) antiporter subunit B n=1 Tax=Streptomyces sp. NPDC094038 TaxID=3366055 RepID=UPI0037F67069
MNTATAQEYLIAVALVLVAASATAAALARDPVRQAVLLAVLGLCLTVLFTLLQAPDVALSQLAVGTAVTPLLILLTVRKVRRATASQCGRDGREAEGTDES